VRFGIFARWHMLEEKREAITAVEAAVLRRRRCRRTRIPPLTVGARRPRRGGLGRAVPAAIHQLAI
jgi:hypothetical protein